MPESASRGVAPAFAARRSQILSRAGPLWERAAEGLGEAALGRHVGQARARRGSEERRTKARGRRAAG